MVGSWIVGSWIMRAGWSPDRHDVLRRGAAPSHLVLSGSAKLVIVPVQSFHYPAAMDASSVIELRQYALQPGLREDLIALFEDEFIEPQRAAGNPPLGPFPPPPPARRVAWL